MSYDRTLTLTLPNNLLNIARMVSQALDPDTGGADSWHSSGTEESPTISMTTLCTKPFYQTAQLMMLDSSLLYQECTADYATRWLNMTGPTQDECNIFVSSIIYKESTTEEISSVNN
jgi:hypothetical protein